jgi:hypothetical protein
MTQASKRSALVLRSPPPRRRKLGFADLVDASWITPYSGATAEKALFEAFRARGLPPPRVVVKTVSGHHCATF